MLLNIHKHLRWSFEHFVRVFFEKHEITKMLKIEIIKGETYHTFHISKTGIKTVTYMFRDAFRKFVKIYRDLYFMTLRFNSNVNKCKKLV